MKKRSSFLKKKKTIFIGIQILLLLAIAITVITLYLKQDDSSKAAQIEDGIANGSASQVNTEHGLENVETSSRDNENRIDENVAGENGETTEGEVSANNENGEEVTPGTENTNVGSNENANENTVVNDGTNTNSEINAGLNTNANNGTNNNAGGNQNSNAGSSTGTTTNTSNQNNQSSNTAGSANTNQNAGNSNNQEEIQLEETIIYEDKLVSEDFLVGWTPISILALASSADRNIYVPELEIEKHSYSEREFSVNENGFELKESNSDFVSVGETILYEITVRNISDIDANHIRIYDLAPEQTTLKQVDSSAKKDENGVMCWEVNIPKLTEVKVRFLVTVNEGATGTIRNTALVDGEETNKTQNPIVEIKKEVKQTEPLYEGDVLDYTITVVNTGDIDTVVNVKDEIPQEVTYVANSANLNAELVEEDGKQILNWNNVSLEKGKTKQFIFQATVNNLPEGVLSEDIINVAVVNGKETNEVKNEVIKPVITREKKNSPEGNVHEGEIITYTIIAGNTGTGAKTIDIVDYAPEGTTFEEVLTYNEFATLVKDNGANGVKWTVTLEPNDSKEFKFSVKVNELPENVYEADIKNTAVVDEIDTNEVENRVVKPFITREKSNSPTKEVIVHEGETITYTIKAGNIGTESKTIDITDEIPEGTTFEKIESYNELATTITEEDKVVGVKWTVELEPNDSKEFVFSVKVNELLENVYSADIKNIAVVDEVNTNEVKNTVLKPFITREKTNTPKGNVHEGDIIEYTIKAGNIGTEAKTIDITDEIPEGTTFEEILTYNNEASTITEDNKVVGVKWTVTLNPNDSKEFKFSVKVNNLPENTYSKDIKNIAVVDKINTEEVQNKVVKPCITREKKNSPEGNVHEGDIITYTIIAGNEGTEAKTIDIIDEIPTGTTFEEILTYNNEASITKNGNKVVGVKWTVTLEPNDSKEFKFSVKVNELPEKTYTTDIINFAVVDGENTNQVQNTVKKPCITREKSNSPTGNVDEGSVITYTIKAGNIGTESKTIDITDSIPEGTTFEEILTYNDLATTIIENDKVVGIKWTVTLEPNDNKEFKFSVKVNDLLENVYSKTIKNIAVVDNTNTNEVQNKVVKPHIISTKLSNPVSATKVEYGQEIEYTIQVKNTGTKEKEVTITDIVPENSQFVRFSSEDNSKNGEEIKDNTGKTTSVKWVKTIYPGSTINFKFTVKVTGPVTASIVNTAVVDGSSTNTTSHSIQKIITAEGKSTGKNIVVVLDLSSSMMKRPGSDSYPADGTTFSDSKLALAKTALNNFATSALQQDLGNTITLITFNYDSYDNDVKNALKKCQELYTDGSWNRIKNATNVHKYIGTQVLVPKTSSVKTIKDAVNAIKLERPLLTNIYSALQLTNQTVDSLKASEPNKDVVVVFIGDGKSSYSTEPAAYVNTEGDTKCGFDTKANTIQKIKDISQGTVENPNSGLTDKATVYTVEYGVPSTEVSDANAVFSKIASDSTKRHKVDANNPTQAADDLNKKLTEIATAIGKTETDEQITNAEGIAKFDIAESGNLFISSTKKLIITYGDKANEKIEFSSIDLLNTDYETTGRVKYENKQIIIDTTKFPADSDITVKYYYSK